MKSIQILKRLLFILVAFFMYSSSLHANSLADIDEELTHADTYYWLGMAEQGNVEAFKKGLSYIASATELAAHGIPDEQSKEAAEYRINTLKSDIELQADMAHDTFYGVFPLVRLLGGNIFMDASTTGNFELVDDSEVAAVSRAAETLMLPFSGFSQVDVIFNSTPNNSSLENEALYIFNTNPKFFAHNRKEILSSMPQKLLDKYNQNNIDQETISHILDTLNVNEVLVVNINKADIIDDIYLYVLRGDIYRRGVSQAVKSVSAMGFSRALVGYSNHVVVANLLLWLMSLAGYTLFRKYCTGCFPSVLEALTIPTAGFLIGRILPCFIISFIMTLAPAPESMAKLSFWWPALLGIAIFAGPGLVFRILSGRIQSYLPALEMSGRGGILFFTLSTGVSAYLATSIFLYLKDGALFLLLPLFLAAGLIAYLIGRSLDHVDQLPLGFLLVSCVGSILLGSAFCSASPEYVWMVLLVLSLIVIIYALKSGLKDVSSTMPVVEVHQQKRIPASHEELISLIEQPPYTPFADFERANERMISFLLENKCTVLALTGPGGRGKTALAQSLLETLQNAGGFQGCNVLVGNCLDEIGEKAVYAPFSQALAGFFGVNVFSPPEEQMAHVDSVLDGLFDSVVPFSGLLFPGGGETYNAVKSKNEIHCSVVSAIKKMAKKNPTILFLDDIQWIDSSSMELLQFILQEIPQGCGVPFAVILTSRSTEMVNSLGLGENSVEVAPLSHEQRASILVETFGIEPISARFVVEQVGSGENDKGELFWLFHMITELVRVDAVTKTDKGFTLSNEIIKSGKLPIPVEFHKALELIIKKHPEFWQIFECAACLGLKFRVSILAEALELSRLNTLETLRRAEDETGILFDDYENDDFFSFRSSLILETLRERMKISGNGPKSKGVPQLLREYHCKIAKAYESLLVNSPQVIFEVANHYFASGVASADKALEYLLKAAISSADLFNYDTARSYLNNAIECGEILGREKWVFKQALLIECQIAHLEGCNRTETAQKCLSVLSEEDTPSCSDLIVYARTCFDAASVSFDQDMFAEAVTLGNTIVEVAQNVYETVEGLHFVGISLPMREADQRKASLLQAYQILEKSDGHDPLESALLARVTNSLAEQLSNGSDDDKQQASELFNLSISIKETVAFRDVPGLARSHGGLGRLALLYTAPPDIESAKKHFQADLEYAEMSGDIVGQSKMHSFLGACCKQDSNLELAADHYRKSFDLAQASIDKYFAGAGLIESICELGHNTGIAEIGAEILSYAKQGGKDGKSFIPLFCAKPLSIALGKCQGFEGSVWFDELRFMVDESSG